MNTQEISFCSPTRVRRGGGMTNINSNAEKPLTNDGMHIKID